jgi:hypothetical protein
MRRKLTATQLAYLVQCIRADLVHACVHIGAEDGGVLSVVPVDGSQPMVEFRVDGRQSAICASSLARPTHPHQGEQNCG